MQESESKDFRSKRVHSKKIATNIRLSSEGKPGKDKSSSNRYYLGLFDSLAERQAKGLLDNCFKFSNP